MAYTTGITSTTAGLLSAIQNACVSDGWTLTGNILNKNDCYVRLVTSGTTVVLTGGTNSTFNVVSGNASFAGVNQDISYPLTYHIHVNELEVYCFINFNVDNYSYLCFGQSPLGNISGTGNWISGTNSGGSNLSYVYSSGDSHSSNVMMFSEFPGFYYTCASYFHHGLNGAQWSGSDRAYAAIATRECQPMLSYSPNAWNGEAPLIPIRPVITGEASRIHYVGQLDSAFYLRIDALTPGQIIIFGNKKYKVYPFIKKNSDDRNVSYQQPHSGTFGIAIFYEWV